MFRHALLIALLVPALAILGCGKKDAVTALPKVVEHGDEAGSNIVIEAEAFTTIEPPMTVEEDKGASGGKYLTIPGNAGKPGGDVYGEEGKNYPDRWGAAIYKFNVTDPGRYRFWGRKLWANGCGNSFSIKVNGGAPVEYGGDGVYDQWDWKPCTVFFDLKAGENTLEVLNREAGVSMDKMIFTKDLQFIPQGKE
jgi:hypothetical protein